MTDCTLVINAGSSSLKFSVFESANGSLDLLLSGNLEELYQAAQFRARDAKGQEIDARSWAVADAPGHDGAIAFLLDWLKERLQGRRISSVGHRVVHGGRHYAVPVRVTAQVIEDLTALEPLAPLHEPHNLKGMRALLKASPDLPQVACFDTAFHTTQPELATMFAIPRNFTDEGVRRYGFHGLSYEYIASVLPTVDPRAASGRTVVLHLGNGASMCAILNGRSVASSMGFTAVDGLVMGTRTGAIDPGVLLYLMDQHKMGVRDIETFLYKKSGLLGVSGLSSDMRVLLESDTADAKLAVDLFCYRAAREIGSQAAALGGVDALVFTAGIGEHAVQVREKICAASSWLGVEMDAAVNARTHGMANIAAPGSKVAVWVIPTNEELMIARHTRRVMEQ